jgi:hypothetical protein
VSYTEIWPSKPIAAPADQRLAGARTQAALTAWRVAEVVAAVQHHVGVAHQRSSSAVGAARHGRTCTSGLMAAHRRLRADSALGCAHARAVVRDLALQVGQVHGVVVDQRDAADAGRAQVQRHRRAQPAGADDQRMRASRRCWPSMPMSSSRMWRE